MSMITKQTHQKRENLKFMTYWGYYFVAMCVGRLSEPWKSVERVVDILICQFHTFICFHDVEDDEDDLLSAAASKIWPTKQCTYVGRQRKMMYDMLGLYNNKKPVQIARKNRAMPQ